MAPVPRLAWLVWRRSRLALGATLGCCGLTLALKATPVGEYAVAVGHVYFVFACLALLSSLTFSESLDVASTASGYPRYLFLLPVRNLALVAWPMLFGSIILAGSWVAWSLITVYRSGGPPSVALPALGLVATLTGLQATCWIPLPIPFARTALAVTSVIGTPTWGVIGLQEGIRPVAIGIGYFAYIAVTFGIAAWGLGLARSGGVDVATLRRRPRSVRSRAAKPFASGMAAQVWYENTHNGLILPVLGCLAFLSYLVPFFGASQGVTADLSGVRFPQLLGLYLMPILCLPMFCSMDGCCSAVQDTFKPDFSLVMLLSARPMSDASLIEAKMRMAARSLAITLAILSPGLILLALSKVQTGGQEITVAQLLAKLDGRVVLLTALALVTIALVSWKASVSAMWMRLSHSARIRVGAPFAIITLILFTVGVSGFAFKNNPAVLEEVHRHLVSILGLLVGLKLVVALVVAKRVRDLSLISHRVLVRWAQTCLAVGFLFFCAYSALIPADTVPRAAIALVLVLLQPLVRVQLAVLTLHANRHR